MMFELPRSSTGNAEGATRLLAFRVWMPPNAADLDPDAGALHNPPLLGTAAAVTAAYQLRWVELVQAYVAWIV